LENLDSSHYESNGYDTGGYYLTTGLNRYSLANKNADNP